MAVRSCQRVFGGNERSGFGIILQGRGRESYLRSRALWLTVDDVMAESTGDVCMIVYLFFISTLTYLLQVRMRATTPFLSDAPVN
jgi:hypothetical protein